MDFKLFLESIDKKRVLAPIGSEHLEHLVKTLPIQVDFGKFKETWYLYFTLWQSSIIEREGGGGRILVSPEPDSGIFDGGILWVHENGQKVIGLYYLDQHSKIAEPFLVKAAKELGIEFATSYVDPAFASKYGFKVVE